MAVVDDLRKRRSQIFANVRYFYRIGKSADYYSISQDTGAFYGEA